MIPRSYHWVLLVLFNVFLLVPAAWGAGLWLYETGGPDLGIAGTGRAALAADASTAGSNPAGMTRLDRSQMLGVVQGLYVNSRFDTQPSGFGGGDGGNDSDKDDYVESDGWDNFFRLRFKYLMPIGLGKD